MRGGSGKTVQVENIGKILQIYNCYDCSIKRFFLVFTVITVRGFNKLLLNQNVNQRKWSHRNYFTSFALKKLGIFVKMESNFMCFFLLLVEGKMFTVVCWLVEYRVDPLTVYF